jgi:hypothetical protein
MTEQEANDYAVAKERTKYKQKLLIQQERKKH